MFHRLQTENGISKVADGTSFHRIRKTAEMLNFVVKSLTFGQHYYPQSATHIKLQLHIATIG